MTTVLSGLALVLAVSRCGPLAQSISKAGLNQSGSDGSGSIPLLNSGSGHNVTDLVDAKVLAEGLSDDAFSRWNADWDTNAQVEKIDLQSNQVKEFRDVSKVEVKFPKEHFPAHVKVAVKLASDANAIPTFELKARPKGDGQTWTLMVDIADTQVDIANLQNNTKEIRIWYSDSDLPIQPGKSLSNIRIASGTQ